MRIMFSAIICKHATFPPQVSAYKVTMETRVPMLKSADLN